MMIQFSSHPPNPHLMLDAEAKSHTDHESVDDIDLPLCLQVDRNLPSLRITRGDLDKYGFTPDCPRCEHTKLGFVAHVNWNHWDSCRRRVYRRMYVAKDPKLTEWLRSHPTDMANVGPMLDLSPATQGTSSSSTAPAPPAEVHAGQDVPGLPPPPGAPGDLRVFDGANENDFTDVVTMLRAYGTEPAEAQRYVTSIVKAKSLRDAPTGFFDVYGQGSLKRAANRLPQLNGVGLEVLDLRSLKPGGQRWDVSRPKDRAWALRLLRGQSPRWVFGAPPCTSFSVLNQNLNSFA